jgi:hypothetical protein
MLRRCRRLGGRTLVPALALLACAGGLGACAGTTTTGTPPPTAPPTTGAAAASARGLTWVLSRGALEHIATDPTALRIVEAGRIYEIVTPGSRPVPGVTAFLTEDFASYAAMEAAVTGGHLLQGVQALLYDPEDWSHTPVNEQTSVTRYIAEAISLARSHGLKIVVTPALDLVKVLSPGPAGASQVSRFLATGVEASTAGADVVDVQAQGMERKLSSYSAFVSGAAVQIHAHSPSTVVIAGLSTNPATGVVTSSDLVAAINSVRGVVGGFWLNMPTRSSFCPSCSSDVNWQAGTGALDAVWG